MFIDLLVLRIAAGLIREIVNSRRSRKEEQYREGAADAFGYFWKGVANPAATRGSGIRGWGALLLPPARPSHTLRSLPYPLRRDSNLVLRLWHLPAIRSVVAVYVYPVGPIGLGQQCVKCAAPILLRNRHD